MKIRVKAGAWLGVCFAFSVTGCVVQHEVAITPDPQVDRRLEGVWRLSAAPPEDGFESDLGVRGYLIFALVQDSTYKSLWIDDFNQEEDTGAELLVTTRRHRGRELMLLQAIDRESTGDRKSSNLLLDYHVDDCGRLSLRFLDVDDFEAAAAAHPVASTRGSGFEPISLTGNEEQVLDFYTDPAVRQLFSGFGVYERLRAPSAGTCEKKPAGPLE